jgi:hypothetical protein
MVAAGAVDMLLHNDRHIVPPNRVGKGVLI